MAQAAGKQAVFLWEGTDKAGKKVSGETSGQNATLVKAILRKQGVNPTSVKKKQQPLFGAKTRKILPKDIAVFSRQLATMMAAGVPLVQSFELVGRSHDNPSMRELVMTIKADVESGGTMADAFRKHPRYFDTLTCNLIHAGEQAGILETLLDKIAIYKEKSEAIKSKVKKALFYPTAVLVVAFIITAVLLIFVIPQFADLFSGFGADLPALTQFVVELSEFLQAYWWAVFGGAGAAGYSFVEAKKKSQAVQDAVERLSLKIPVIGDILNKAAVARFARTLSTMFAAGVPLVDALESVAGAVGNVVYRNAIVQIRSEVSTGTSLTDSMTRANVFPPMVTQMASIGEEAGSLDSMLGKVADMYEQEVDDAVDALSSLLEPLIMAVLGVLVGGLVIAMYLPIFKMGSVVG